MKRKIHFVSLSHPSRKIRNLKSFECLKIKPLKIQNLSDTYDYGLITSQVTVLHLSKIPQCGQWIAIGSSTAAAFRKKFPRERNLVILKQSHSKGVVEFFKNSSRIRGRIFFPRSQRGAPELPASLRKLGYRVSVRWAYQTRIQSQRGPLESWLLSKLNRGHPVVLLLTSPSAVQGLRRSLRGRLQRHPLVHLVSIGPSTSNALKSLGLKFIESPQAQLEKMQNFARRHLHVLWKKTH